MSQKFCYFATIHPVRYIFRPFNYIVDFTYSMCRWDRRSESTGVIKETFFPRKNAFVILISILGENQKKIFSIHEVLFALKTQWCK